MSIFSRLFSMIKAESHAAIDKIEDPVKMTEQGIRDLKKDLESNLRSMAEAKAILIRMRKDVAQHKEEAASYEKKAILLLKRAESGHLDPTEADRLATEALAKKEQALAQALTLNSDLEVQENQTQKLQGQCDKLKSNIAKWENELTTLKARSKIAAASKKLNRQLAAVDSDGTIALLEKMKSKVADEEALSQSYAQMATLQTSIDDEIDRAISGGDKDQVATSEALAKLKAKISTKEL